MLRDSCKQALGREPSFGERWDVFCALPARPNAILDVGCGTGMGFQTYRERGCRVVGVDIDEEALAEAFPRLDETYLHNVEADVWPQAFTGAFDVIAFCDCLEHLVDPWAVLQSVRPLLTPRGVVVASIPNVRQARIVVKLLLGRWEYQPGAGTVQRGHLRFFTRRTVIDMFNEAGYETPRFYFPMKTFHLARRLEQFLHLSMLGRAPDLW